jgi:UDP-glucose 4-epimerase
MVDRLVAMGHTVTVYDNLSTGFARFLDGALKTGRAKLVQGDLLDLEELKKQMAGHEVVFHFAANADVRFGIENPRRDLEQNTIGTFNVLEAMRANGVRQILFSSTGAIYGESPVVPTPEDASFPLQTSFYGASKLAGEGLMEAYSEAFGWRVWIFRFVSILGERYHHGHVYDFYRKLQKDPNRLHVLGDGTQKKSYLYVGDCIEAIVTAWEKAAHRLNIFNLGTEEYCDVTTSIRIICERLGLNPALEFEGGPRGWVGDNPFILLDCTRIRSLGWKPKLSIREGILRTLNYLIENPWVLDAPRRLAGK